MTVEIREVSHNGLESRQPLLRPPTIIKWKDKNIIRNQSITAAIRELIFMIQNIDVINIEIIGNPSSGKTELAKTMAHIFHVLAEKLIKMPFSVKLFDKTALLNFEATLKSLTPTNWVLIFDDLSFMGANASKKQMDIVKQAFTEIRHLEGGKDVKIIIIKISHYLLALDKYLRQSEFSFYTTVGSSEGENMERIIGAENMKKVDLFKKIHRMAISKVPGKFTYRLGDKGTFTYSYKDPFIPLLFWNGDSLRHLVSPNRKWLEHYCHTCSLMSDSEAVKAFIDVEKFVDENGDKYGESIFKTAVRNKALKAGIDVNHPSVISAGKYLDKCLASGNVTLEQILNHYGMKPAKVRLKKKLDGEILKPKKLPVPPKEPEILKTDNFEDQIENGVNEEANQV